MSWIHTEAVLFLSFPTEASTIQVCNGAGWENLRIIQRAWAVGGFENVRVVFMYILLYPLLKFGQSSGRVPANIWLTF